MGNIGLFTYLFASISFAILAALLLLHWRPKPLGPTLVVACATSSAWATIIALGTLADYPPITAMQLSELARNAVWLYFLLQLMGLQSDDSLSRVRGVSWKGFFWIALGVLLLIPPFLAWLQVAPSLAHTFMLATSLSLSLLGLLLIEQLYRNAAEAERWLLKFLCLGIGAFFAWDFFMYSEALLFKGLDPDLWQARGLVNAVITPLLGVAFARHSNLRVQLQVSRQVVFHTVTLMGAGFYLLAMAGIGYFLKFMGGTWGTVLQLGFLVAAGALLASLLFSGRLRALLRVELSKHFFSYRYDYRDEWLKFTQALASLNEDVEEGIIRIMASLASSRAGLLWGAGDGQPQRLLAQWEMSVPEGVDEGLGSLPEWLHRTTWVIDLKEYRRTPDLYTDLQLPQWLEQDTSLWLIIPLLFRDRLDGILMLRESNIKNTINWEDRDLLKTAGCQAASHLAQHLASQALIEARQFDAFNRLSAYVVHDLKNILAQQSLIVSNAAKHRDNPAFIDDMIDTVGNSVARMQRLMEQMRTGMRSLASERVLMAPLLERVIAARSGNLPIPASDFTETECAVEADSERLATVFNHLIQNAQDATDPEGSVRVQLTLEGKAILVCISDTGHGMDDAFLRERLFKPFESTKGLTGMGIGVFESREYIRQIGGDIRVQSVPGKGSTFCVTLPHAAAIKDNALQEGQQPVQ